MSRLIATFSHVQIPLTPEFPGTAPTAISPDARISPDYPTPVVRTADGERELIMIGWSMPSPTICRALRAWSMKRL
jgi:hypothetical protein